MDRDAEKGCAAVFVVLVVLCTLFGLGFFVGAYSIKHQAVKAGAARWELLSQENPAIVFKWNAPNATQPAKD